MKLRKTDVRKTNNINSFIRNYALVAEMTFAVCKRCRGTGLGGFSHYGGSWDGSTYCDECLGTGFMNWEENELIAVCDKCKGTGFVSDYRGYDYKCSVCDGKGVVDWLEGIKLGIGTGIPK